MITVAVIGAGQVAEHLILAFQNAKDIQLVKVIARKPQQLTNLLGSHGIISKYSQLKEVDLYIIAVSDIAIATVSSQIPVSYTHLDVYKRQATACRTFISLVCNANRKSGSLSSKEISLI